jgi:hypothetical protein
MCLADIWSENVGWVQMAPCRRQWIFVLHRTITSLSEGVLHSKLRARSLRCIFNVFKFDVKKGLTKKNISSVDTATD